MQIRYAIKSDFNFLIEGLEKNRIIEKRPEKDIKAKPSDIEEFKNAIESKNIRIVEKDDEPIAFLYFRTDFKVMFVYDKFFWVDLLYVKENHRGMGLGTLLYEDILKIAKKGDYKKIIIDIFEANKKSSDFFKKIEFRPVYTIYQKDI